MKRAKTMSAPSNIPITTHSLRPKIEVGFDNSVSTNAASYTDISSIYVYVCEFE